MTFAHPGASVFLHIIVALHSGKFRHKISESGDFNSWSGYSRFLHIRSFLHSRGHRCAARLLCQRRRPSNTVICVRDAERTYLLPECLFEMNLFDDDDYLGAPAENGERLSQKPPLEWHEAKPKTSLK